MPPPERRSHGGTFLGPSTSPPFTATSRLIWLVLMNGTSIRTVSQDAPSPTHDVLLEALGDGTRRAILEQLRDGPKSVVEIARGLPVRRPAVSQHLKVLKAAGLVTDQAVGTRRVYRIDPQGLKALEDYARSFWSAALTRYGRAARRAPERATAGQTKSGG
jgi:DNA-binding transcriptional ArsR family regulator